MLKFILVTLTITFLAWIQLPVKKSSQYVKNISTTIDGPYVLYKGDSVLINYIDSANGQVSLRTDILEQSQLNNLQLVVNTDEPGKTFSLKLHPKLSTEKNNYNRVSKMLVISDIEGEFAAMRKLLQSNGVIDENFKWTFGNGHLVLVGDFVDRGTMVTEVLWLIYSLENQAEESGGKVHFILGNHEIMNMNGDHNYVNPKYQAHAGTMGVSYLELFGQQAELGRWLATKNITERIDRMLFMHGGFSFYMNQAQMPLQDINDTARIYFTDTSMVYPSPYSDLLYSDYGPFWYRGYYMGDARATNRQVDSTLSFYNCRHIVTGHTTISKEIVSVYDGKIIDMDVPHKSGYSEALYIEGNNMYRVNTRGEHFPLVNLKR